MRDHPRRMRGRRSRRARRFILSERSMSMKRSLQVLLVTALGFLGSSLSWADVAAVGTGTGVALATGGGAAAVGSAVAVALSSGGCDCDDDDSAAAVAVGTGVALEIGRASCRERVES